MKTRAIAIFALSITSGSGQSLVRQPTELIDFLNHEEHARPGSLAQLGLFTCGQLNADREAMTELVAHGDRAIPAVVKGLRDGMGAGWIQMAYAQLRGRDAYPDLFRIAHDRRHDSNAPSNHDAIALSLGITSFVSTRFPTGRGFRCGEEEQPRHALDRLIAGWLQMDYGAVLSALAPRTKAAFEQQVSAKHWSRWAHSGWRGNPPDWTAVGYQLESADLGGQLKSAQAAQARPQTGEELARRPSRSESVVRGFLKGYDGQSCENFRMRIVQRTPDEAGRYLGYGIETEDLGAFLESVARCAQRFR